MSGPVVVIGYILLIPSIIGVVFSALMLFVSGGATTQTLDALKAETRATLAEAAIPDPIIENIIAFEPISDPDLSALSEEQRRFVSDAKLTLAAGMAGAGIGGAFAGGASICMGVSFFVGGLLGWLLIMKKKVLQCTSCGAVVAAS